jgi:hypothetical protein
VLPLALDRLWQHRLPKAYRPGATLARLAQDLTAVEFVGEEDGRPCYRLPGAHWRFGLLERVESQLLLHTVSCRFVLPLPGHATQTACRVELQHVGNWRREGFACFVRLGERDELASLVQRLESDKDLHAALMPLDFKQCVLLADGGKWRLEIEHFAASEVVGRFPPFRRYIRLIKTQQLAVLASMAAIHRLFTAMQP